MGTFNYWAWSRDGKYLYYDGPEPFPTEVRQLRVADDRDEKVTDLSGIHRTEGELGSWFGIGPDDSPLLLRNTGTQQIYAVDWDAP